MLLAGSFRGVNELDTWDAACLAWAHLDETARATAETLNPEGPQKLRDMLMPSTVSPDGIQTTTNDSASDVDQLRELMQRPKEVQTVTT